MQNGASTTLPPLDNSLVKSTAVKTVEQLKYKKEELSSSQSKRYEKNLEDSSNIYDEMGENMVPKSDNKVMKKRPQKVKRPLSSNKKIKIFRQNSNTQNGTERLRDNSATGIRYSQNQNNNNSNNNAKEKPSSQSNLQRKQNSFALNGGKVKSQDQNYYSKIEGTLQQSLQQNSVLQDKNGKINSNSQNLKFSSKLPPTGNNGIMQQNQQQHQVQYQEENPKVQQRQSLMQQKKNHQKTLQTYKNGGQSKIQQQQFEEELAGKYFNVDLDMAVDFFIQKGRLFKEKVEAEEIPIEFVSGAIINSKVFRIRYNNLLQKMCQAKSINQEFRNMQKKPFAQIEQFFIQQLDQAVKKEKLEVSIKQKTKSVKDQLRKQKQMIDMEILKEQNFEWNWDDL